MFQLGLRVWEVQPVQRALKEKKLKTALVLTLLGAPLNGKDTNDEYIVETLLKDRTFRLQDMGGLTRWWIRKSAESFLRELLIILIRKGDAEALEFFLPGDNCSKLFLEYELPYLYFAVEHDQVDCARILVEKQIEVNIEGPKTFYPLHVACIHNFVRCAEFLLNNGADTDVTDITGSSPLHLAVKFKSFECFKLLVDHGANIWCTDIHHSTLLHVAVQHDSVDCARALIELGMDINGQTTYGFTPLHFSWRSLECATL